MCTEIISNLQIAERGKDVEKLQVRTARLRLSAIENSTSKTSKKFVNNWGAIDECIVKDPNNETNFMCLICNIRQKASSKTSVTKHLDSIIHENNIKSAATGVNAGQNKPSSKRIFMLTWLEDPRFESWLQACPNDEYKFHCKVCNVDCTCTAGIMTLKLSIFCNLNKYKSQKSRLKIN